jgi:hypothetical protein
VNLTAPTPSAPPERLKGADFAARVRDICRVRPAARPLRELAHRRILIPGVIGGEIQFALLGFVAHALRLRGAEVTCLLCDEILPACTLRKVDHVESACSRWCYRNARPFIEAAQLPHRWYGEFVTPAERERCMAEAQRVGPGELLDYTWRGIHIGAHLPRSIESFFRVGRFDPDNPAMVAKARELLAAGMCLTLVGERAIEAQRIEKVLMEDGLKIDWGVIRDVARARGIPVDVILGCPRGHSLLIEHDRGLLSSDPYPRWAHWRGVALSADEERELDQYLHSRATRPYEDQTWSAVRRMDEPDVVRARIGLPLDRRAAARSPLVFSMFPNLSWDAAVTTTQPAYAVAADWVLDTVECFRRVPHRLVIKAHPAELHQGALDPLGEHVRQNVGELPANVHLLPPDTELTAQDLVRASDIVLVYTSTVAIEAACLGKTVVNAGGGWHAGRGWTHDAPTPSAYRNLLAQAHGGRLGTVGSVELARRYAYMVFFRCALPVRHYEALYPNVLRLNLGGLDELAPGRDATIDAVCRGVLCGAPFERA